jgi:hypothetical protein
MKTQVLRTTEFQPPVQINFNKMRGPKGSEKLSDRAENDDAQGERNTTAFVKLTS